jgi:hypothetical protein
VLPTNGVQAGIEPALTAGLKITLVGSPPDLVIESTHVHSRRVPTPGRFRDCHFAGARTAAWRDAATARVTFRTDGAQVWTICTGLAEPTNAFEWLAEPKLMSEHCKGPERPSAPGPQREGLSMAGRQAARRGRLDGSGHGHGDTGGWSRRCRLVAAPLRCGIGMSRLHPPTLGRLLRSVTTPPNTSVHRNRHRLSNPTHSCLVDGAA